MNHKTIKATPVHCQIVRNANLKSMGNFPKFAAFTNYNIKMKHERANVRVVYTSRKKVIGG